MNVKKLTDNEKAEVVENCKSILFNAGFDNVVILANEGGSLGAIGIACAARPALMRLLMASYFMDKTMDRMVNEESTGMTLWKHLLKSILETIVPEIRKQEEELRDGNRVSKIVSFGIGKD